MDEFCSGSQLQSSSTRDHHKVGNMAAQVVVTKANRTDQRRRELVQRGEERVPDRDGRCCDFWPLNDRRCGGAEVQNSDMFECDKSRALCSRGEEEDFGHRLWTNDLSP